jgi:tRNA nucleotidyltransferase (CCA-adding enzyme)
MPSQQKPLNLAKELQQKFPAEVLSTLREVGKVASQMGVTAYAVGGFVRDLLLGTPTLDIDIVVEGNGIALAQKLSQIWQVDLTVHERFLTATLHWRLKEPKSASTPAPTHACALSRLDIATARKERYPNPAALPEVEPASIFDDLWRRDFTINAMAICLDPKRFGELVDPTGGFNDLRQGVIRVLHKRSFVDDPTRIFRAVRYEQRFDFEIERKTLQLIRHARNESLLTKLSRDRIKHELWRILQERDPTKPMRRLSELRILPVIAPELCVTKKRLEWMRRTNEWLNWFAEKFPEKPLEREWALLLPLLPTVEAVNSFSQRYQLGESERECGLALLKALKRRTPKRPSNWVRWLNPLPLEAALVLAAKRSSPNDLLWQRYFLEWRWTRPDITGEDLKACGIAGRAISVGLQAALAVKLDEGADAHKQLEVALRRAQPYRTLRR